MDSKGFDIFTRAFAAAKDRRRFLSLVGGGAVAALGGPPEPVAARLSRHRRSGASCRHDRQCCSGVCRDGRCSCPAGQVSCDEVCADLLDDAAARLGVARRRVAVVRVEPPDWPDACLGCAEEGDVCAAVITPGHLVVVAAAGQELEYHTWTQGRTFRVCS